LKSHFKNYSKLGGNGLPIRVLWMDSQTRLELHEHDFHELVVIFGGEGIHYTRSEKYRIGQGDVFLIKPGTQHGYDNTNDLKLINIIYLPDILKLSLYDLVNSPGYHAFFEVEPAMRKQHGFKSRLRLSSTKLAYLMKLISSMERELNSGKPDALFMSVSYFMQVIGFVARSYTRSEVPEQKDIFYLGEVVSYIESNYQRKITTAELAKKASMSGITLYRMFKKAFNMSPVNYILSVRIAAARRLLAETELNISEIAWRTGFPDSNYFSRSFKKLTNVSPRHYRERQNE
jgi:AraC-like DNA-binding protein/quercetin dioxygenase-like cupin family protein